MRRRGRSRPETLRSLVPRVLDDLGFGEASAVMRVCEGWEEAVGSEVAAHCRPSVLRGDLLEVTVDSSVWCQQLQLRIPELLEALRRVLGDTAPARLRLRVGRLD